MTDPQIRRGTTHGGRPKAEDCRRRLKISLAWLTVGISIAAASAAWLSYRASIVSSELKSVRQLLPQLKDQLVQNNPTEAAATVDQLIQHSSAARRAASDPLWTLAAEIPALGANFAAGTAVATAADDVIQLGGDPLVRVAGSINWRGFTPATLGTNLKPLMLAQPRLSSAAHAVRQSSDRLNEIDETSLLPVISGPLSQAREELNGLRGSLDAAADAATIVPSMMGATTPRKYLLLIQNNSESRATGGIPGALAVIQVDNGKLSLSHQTGASQIGPMAPTIRVDPEQEQIFSGRVGKFMQDVNLTPDFPTAASTAVSMWKQKTGDQLDGAVSIDPVALSYLMEATGQVDLSRSEFRHLDNGLLPTQLTAKNIVKTLLSDVYFAVPEPEGQDLYFASVAQELFSALSSGKSNEDKLLSGISRGVTEGRVMVWSAHQDEQAVLADHVLSGSIDGPSISPAQFGIYFNDGTGAKMDYYVRRTVQLHRMCASDGYSEVKLVVTSTNAAPKDAATSLPDYVTGAGAFDVPAGHVQTNIVAYGPVQSDVETVTVDGKKTVFSAQRHGERPVGTITTRLAPGESTRVEFRFGKIVQHSLPQVRVTPTVQPLKDVVLSMDYQECAPSN